MFKREPQIPEVRKLEILDKIKPLIAAELGINPEKVTLGAKIVEDLGVDSLNSIEMIMILEETFNLEILDDDAEKMKTVDDVLTYLAERTKA